MDAVRTDGDWEGVAATANEAVATARSLSALVGDDRARTLRSKSTIIGAIRLFEHLPQHLFVTVTAACKLLGASKPTAGHAVEALERAGTD